MFSRWYCLFLFFSHRFPFIFVVFLFQSQSLSCHVLRHNMSLCPHFPHVHSSFFLIPVRTSQWRWLCLSPSVTLNWIGGSWFLDFESPPTTHASQSRLFKESVPTPGKSYQMHISQAHSMAQGTKIWTDDLE